MQVLVQITFVTILTWFVWKSEEKLWGHVLHISIFQASTEITLFGTEVLSKKPHFSSTMSEILFRS